MSWLRGSDRGGVPRRSRDSTATAPTGILRGREGETDIPADLDGVVIGVFGLDQRRVARRLTGAGAANAASAATPDPLGPADLEKRYSFPDGDCAGQTIAIAEFGGGYFPDDVRTFCETHGRTLPQIETVSVGATSADSRADRGAVGGTAGPGWSERATR